MTRMIYQSSRITAALIFAKSVAHHLPNIIIGRHTIYSATKQKNGLKLTFAQSITQSGTIP